MPKKRMHPEGVASLIAVILAPEGLSETSYNQHVDRTREAVLELANAYYKVNECDFDNGVDVRHGTAVNNLAKLNRANLRT